MNQNPICPHCDEAIDGVPRYVPDAAGARMAWHDACFRRLVIGGLNHLRGDCSCCGGSEPPDPPELSRRQAALAAVAYFESRRQ